MTDIIFDPPAPSADFSLARRHPELPPMGGRAYKQPALTVSETLTIWLFPPPDPVTPNG